MSLSDKYSQIIERIDAENSEDPNQLDYCGVAYAKEVLYSNRHLAWVLELNAEASECLRIAAKAQHICRWEIPRSDFPVGKAGYFKWREGLKRFHAEKTGALMAEVGYEPEAIERVQSLNLKRNLKTDAECQTLEDALCLSFLELGFDDLIAKHGHEKMVDIVAKTAAKMSQAGIAKIADLPLSSAGKAVIAAL